MVFRWKHQTSAKKNICLCDGFKTSKSLDWFVQFQEWKWRNIFHNHLVLYSCLCRMPKERKCNCVSQSKMNREYWMFNFGFMLEHAGLNLLFMVMKQCWRSQHSWQLHLACLKEGSTQRTIATRYSFQCCSWCVFR